MWVLTAVKGLKLPRDSECFSASKCAKLSTRRKKNRKKEKRKEEKKNERKERKKKDRMAEMRDNDLKEKQCQSDRQSLGTQIFSRTDFLHHSCN